MRRGIWRTDAKSAKNRNNAANGMRKRTSTNAMSRIRLIRDNLSAKSPEALSARSSAVSDDSRDGREFLHQGFLTGLVVVRMVPVPIVVCPVDGERRDAIVPTPGAVSR